MMKNCVTGVVAFFLSVSACSQTITGKIFNSRTKEPLPFVNISVARSTAGTTADVEGKFKLNLSADSADLIFSFVGFETQLISVSRQNTQSLLVGLEEKTTELNTVTVDAGENPALRIIRKVVQNKIVNDPENLPSFSYHSYNKLYMTAVGSLNDSARRKKALSRIDSTVRKNRLKARDQARIKSMIASSDSANIKKARNLRKFTDTHHFFMTESYTERKYLKPNHSIETILGNRMSGVKDPFFASMGTDFQPFSFYKDFILLFDVNYLNPISDGSDKKYYFTLTDTLFHGADSVYTISFEPIEGKSFQALKGQLYINTNGYAIEHVLAMTADEKALIEFHLQQKYARIDGHWFPVQLNSELRFKEYKLTGTEPRFIDRSYLSDIRIGDKIPKKEFGFLNVEFAPKANNQNEEFWVAHRPDTLDKKERNTYRFYDQPNKWTKLMNYNMRVVEALVVGRLRIGSFYIPLDNLLRVNNYEGLRIGFGLETGERISNTFSLTGYTAYGFHDKALKYGAGLQINLIPHKDGFVKFAYSRDVGEPGVSNFIRTPVGAINNESLRNWFIFRMDSIRQYKLEFNIRSSSSSQFSVFAHQQNRNPTYNYSYATEKDVLAQRTNFIAMETGIQWRFAWKERYTQIGNGKVATTIAYPQINAVVSHGISGLLNGEYDFTKLEVKYDDQWIFRGFGATTMQFTAGKIYGNVPYPFLFNGKGSHYDNSFLNSFVVNNYFQTMGFYEFASDQFAYLFLNHNFGRLTGTKNATFRPELQLVHNMGVGSLRNLSDHQGIAIKTMDKGFLESGLIINNLLRFKYLKLYYFGLGLGAFGRYGSYALPVVTDNLSFKFMLTASF